MRFISYNKEINIATKQIMDVFNNIRIKRWAGPCVEKIIHVPCVYGNRSRILKSLENRAKNLQLPLISITKTDISRDADRAHSVNDGLFFGDNSYDLNENVGVPIKIEFDVSIICKYESDMDQILCNFMAMMNPDIYVTWPNPKGQGNITSQIVWDGTTNIEYPIEISETDPWRVSATARMTFKTWIFPGEGLYGYNIDATVSECDDYGQPGSDPNNVYSSNRIEYINICECEPISANFDIEGANIGTDQKWNTFYDVPNDMTFTEFLENINNGTIYSSAHDQLGIVGTLSGSYFLEIYGVSGNYLYSPRVAEDLPYLINNYDNMEITMLTQDGNFFYPEHLEDFNWLPIWTEMLSGKLSCCLVDNSKKLHWLLNEDSSQFYILLENSNPILLQP